MAIPEPRIASLHIGRIQAYTDADGTPWQSAIAKAEVPGPLRLGRLGPAGDAVADTVHHGGEHHAVMVYSRTHASYWKDRLGLDIGPGGLGENLSVEGLEDETVCVGDTFRAGGALLQVSQPRQPCKTLSRYWRCPDLLPAIWETARSGWYFRVLEEGPVNPGDALLLRERPHPGWTVARLLRLLRDQEPADSARAAGLEALSPGWRARFEGFARKG